LPADFERFAAARVIRARLQGFMAMIRSVGTGGGFDGRVARVASARLTNAVVAALAVGAFSLCLTVAFTVMSIKVAMAMPIAG
jgi:hypothetical protein